MYAHVYLDQPKPGGRHGSAFFDFVATTPSNGRDLLISHSPATGPESDDTANGSWTITAVPAAEPSSLLLLGTGMVALFALAFRKPRLAWRAPGEFLISSIKGKLAS